MTGPHSTCTQRVAALIPNIWAFTLFSGCTTALPDRGTAVSNRSTGFAGVSGSAVVFRVDSRDR